MCNVATVLTNIYKTFTIHYFWYILNFMSFIMKSKLQNACIFQEIRGLD